MDHALRLVILLQQEGPLRVADAAERLGVARSTAHRLLAMLVYRDFAERDVSRRYAAGPFLRRPARLDQAGNLRRVGLPYLQMLTAQLGETTNLIVVVGDQARFVVTAECSQLLRVGDREGMILPAHLASGGLAGLAQLPQEQVAELYSRADSPVADAGTLLRKLRLIRRQGFAVNNQATEVGVTALGIPVRSPAGSSPAALSVAIPTVRFRRDRIPAWLEPMRQCAARIGESLTLAPAD